MINPRTLILALALAACIWAGYAMRALQYPDWCPDHPHKMERSQK